MTEPTPPVDDRDAAVPAESNADVEAPPQVPPFGLLDVLAVALLLGASLYLFVTGIGNYGLWEPWEPKYAVAVREMMERDDIVTPYYDGEIRWTKPIGIYWAMYPLMAQWGNNAFSARLPSALAATLGVLLVFLVLRRLRGRVAASMGALVLMTIPQYFYMARQAMPDMLLTATLTGAMAAFAWARFGKGFASGKTRLPFSCFYACVGLSFLAKGPVGGAVVVASLATFLLLDFDPRLLRRPREALREARGFLSRYHVLLGILVFVLVAGPWYALMLMRHGNEFIDSFLMDENMQRFGKAVRGHGGTSAYYLKTMQYGMYPWIALLPVSLAFICGRKLGDEQRQRYYFLCWMLAPFLLFTFAGTKIDHYILPITPAIAVLVGLFWADYFDRRPQAYVQPALILAVLFCGACVQDFFIKSSSEASVGPKLIFDVFLPEYEMNKGSGETATEAIKIFFIAWSALCVLAALWRRSYLAVALLVIVAYAHAIHMSHVLLPPQSDQRSFKHYVDVYNELRGPDALLLQIGSEKHSLRYYLGDENYHYYRPRHARKFLDDALAAQEVFLIVREEDTRAFTKMLERGREGEEWEVLADSQRRYSLLGVKQE